MSDLKLLKMLADGGFHSGDDLGAELGISRAAVWKQIKKLQGHGFDIYSVRGKGYRLSEPLSLLDKETLLRGIASEIVGKLAGLDVFGSINSTNDHAMTMATEGIASGYFCLAERQFAGRGRRGRQWVSPFGKNVYMSCVWHFYSGAAALEGLSLAAGVAVVRALKGLGVTGLSLKWPNDIYFNSKKLGGILLEMTGDPSGRCQVVLGVGLNIAMPDDSGEKIDQPWTDLESVAGVTDRNLVVSRLIEELVIMLSEFESKGFLGFRDEWSGLDAYLGKSVVVSTGLSTQHGVASGVDNTGALLLMTDLGMEEIKGGEVSLRPMQ